MKKELLFIITSIVGVLAFFIIPIILVIGNSLKSGYTNQWVGLANYTSIFQSEPFILATKNTLFFLVISLPLLLITSFYVAFLLQNQYSFFLSKGYIFLISFAIPSASMPFFWRFLFSKSGILNSIINTDIDWLNSKYSLYAIVFIYVWKNFGFILLIWIGGLSRVPQSTIEAGIMDGANTFTMITKIILPQLKRVIFTVFLLSLVNAFKIFRDIYAISGDYPHETIYMLQHLFNNWFQKLSIEKLATGTVVYIFALLMVLYPLNKYSEEA